MGGATCTTIMEAFTNWLKGIVNEWRVQTAGMSTATKRGQLFDFSPPCQIHVLHLSNPYHRIDYRMCIVSHLADAGDKDIQIHGPYSPMAFTAGIEKFLDRPEFKIPVEHQWQLNFAKGLTYADALSETIGNAYSGARVYLNNSVKAEPIMGSSYGMGTLANGSFFWGIAGEIEVTNPEPSKYVAAEFERAKIQAIPGKTQQQASTKVLGQGLGAFIIPGIWVGSRPKLGLAQRLDGVHMQTIAHRKIVVETEMADRRLTVTQSGFVAIEESNKKQAAELLNRLFAVLLRRGVAATAVAPTDLLSPSDITQPLTSYSYEGDVHHEQLDRLSGSPHFGALDDSNLVVPTKEIEASCKEITSSLDMQHWLSRQLCLDAATFQRRREFRSSLLASWTAIEIVLVKKWKEHLNQGSSSRSALKRLERWNVNQIIDTLNHSGLVSAAELDGLHWLRSKRNRVMHTGIQANEKESERALNLVLNSIDWLFQRE